MKAAAALRPQPFSNVPFSKILCGFQPQGVSQDSGNGSAGINI